MRDINQHLEHIHLPVVPSAYFKSSNHASPTASDVLLPDGSVVHITHPRGWGKTKLYAEMAERLHLSVADVVRALNQLDEAFGPLRDALTDAGVLDDPGPSDPQARALWLRQNRSTGPARPSGPAAYRPRKHR